MEFNHVHFIGGGRITRIFLQAFANKGITFNKTTVTDCSVEVLHNLKSLFPKIETSQDNNFGIADADIVFIALHPPVFIENLMKLKDFISKDAAIISLAPKITIQKISEILGDQKNIGRIIPTALTVTGNGYNPVSFSPNISNEMKNSLMETFRPFGFNFETAESKLEAYAIITAMSPTYFWYQFFELLNVAKEIGLSEEEALAGIISTLKSSLDIMADKNFTEAGILDLIPVKPLKDMEEVVKKEYREKLTGLFQKIKP